MSDSYAEYSCVLLLSVVESTQDLYISKDILWKFNFGKIEH